MMRMPKHFNLQVVECDQEVCSAGCSRHQLMGASLSPRNQLDGDVAKPNQHCGFTKQRLAERLPQAPAL